MTTPGTHEPHATRALLSTLYAQGEQGQISNTMVASKERLCGGICDGSNNPSAIVLVLCAAVRLSYIRTPFYLHRPTAVPRYQPSRDSRQLTAVPRVHVLARGVLASQAFLPGPGVVHPKNAAPCSATLFAVVLNDN